MTGLLVSHGQETLPSFRSRREIVSPTAVTEFRAAATLHVVASFLFLYRNLAGWTSHVSQGRSYEHAPCSKPDVNHAMLLTSCNASSVAGIPGCITSHKVLRACGAMETICMELTPQLPEESVAALVACLHVVPAIKVGLESTAYAPMQL